VRVITGGLRRRAERAMTTTAKTAAWHPGTKLLVVAALAAVPYLWWTRPGAPPPVAAPPPERAASGDAGAAGGVAAVAAGAALEPYALPPLERFAAVVERPLFSPTRRMPPIEEPPPEVEPAPTEAPAAVSLPGGPEEPDVRFFGTARQGERTAALVTFPSNNAVARLAVGDRVGEWEVLEVERNRLVLGVGEERRLFEIFGAGAREVPADAGTVPATPDAPSPDLPPELEEPPADEEAEPAFDEEEVPVE
jgi:general secretion pathway protein N